MRLKDATDDLHHAAERHPVGQAMADGSISPAWWCDWLGGLRVIHARLDPYLPPLLNRMDEVEADLAAMLPIEPSPNYAAAQYAKGLTTAPAITGATYVFLGAHLFGGAMMARAIGGRLPTGHTQWSDHSAAAAAWRPWREDTRPEVIEAAKDAFRAVLAIMDEIQ